MLGYCFAALDCSKGPGPGARLWASAGLQVRWTRTMGSEKLGPRTILCPKLAEWKGNPAISLARQWRSESRSSVKPFSYFYYFLKKIAYPHRPPSSLGPCTSIFLMAAEPSAERPPPCIEDGGERAREEDSLHLGGSVAGPDFASLVLCVAGHINEGPTA